MKSLALFLILSVSAVGLWAQAAPQTPAPPPPPAGHHHMDDHMMAMHHHMQMQEQVAKMRATLEKMKANLAKISDPVLKQQAQLDADLWEEMVQHLEGMAKMMQGHMGMMGDTKSHSAMPDEQSPPPVKK